MKKIFLSVIFLTLFVICESAGYAQTAPASVKREILSNLKKHARCKSQGLKFDVQKVKIGPNKLGFTGSCLLEGGVFFLFEKSGPRLVKLIEVTFSGLQAKLTPRPEVIKGYYDIYFESRLIGAGLESCYITFRWDGDEYLIYKHDCSN